MPHRGTLYANPGRVNGWRPASVVAGYVGLRIVPPGVTFCNTVSNRSISSLFLRLMGFVQQAEPGSLEAVLRRRRTIHRTNGSGPPSTHAGGSNPVGDATPVSVSHHNYASDHPIQRDRRGEFIANVFGIEHRGKSKWFCEQNPQHFARSFDVPREQSAPVIQESAQLTLETRRARRRDDSRRGREFRGEGLPSFLKAS